MLKNFGGHGVAEPLLVTQLTGAGFKLVGEIPNYPPSWNLRNYAVVLEKPAGTAAR